MGTRAKRNKEPSTNKIIQGVAHPRKRFYRARAHSNPFNDEQYPVSHAPQFMDWHVHFPHYFKPLHADVASRQSTDTGAGKSGGEGAPKQDEHEQGQQQQEAVQQDSTGQEQQYLAIQQDSTGRQQDKQVEMLDVGCGFGGMTLKLAELYPQKLIMGLEIRDKVVEYVKQRIAALRRSQPPGGVYNNCSVMRLNAMRHLPNVLYPSQLSAMFVLFPDPHFKASNHRRRIITVNLLTEYAHFIKINGMLYIATDVKELYDWMVSKLESHPLFVRVSDAEVANDDAYQAMSTATEESQKVTRNGGNIYKAAYRRVKDDTDYGGQSMQQ